ncbi:MAG: 3-hydroxyacyl-CoA dehydrogenase/enoyl-CoA hydratase family protein [Anaerolineae bacterium]|nr:3-hydroxyacyl-CoA dehydrogenase/enoyl-CoA hydratase family protein [Anaerolineae bacterium]
MSYQIRKAAVIGSGTMGGGIAALLASVGIPVLLLDIPAPDTKPGDAPAKRNAIVNGNLTNLIKGKPAQFFKAADVELVTTGNTEDDLSKLADADWVVEVIIEKLPIKQDLMARIDAVRKPGSIITTNTSGLSIAAICQGRSEDFRRHFLGTHFFNPPRYLKLLEIIPHPETDPALVDFMFKFGSERLGKGCVLCKDTPNFIANRFISIIGSVGINYALDNGYTVEEIDAITGPLIGHPKTATFRLQDLVGIDVSVYVGRNLYDAVVDDPWRDVLHHEKADQLFDWLMSNKFLGRKTKQGFYKTVTVKGERVHMPLNLQTLEYEEPQKVRFESVGKHRKIENTGARIKAMINEEDRAGQYLWHLHAALFTYASLKLGEIANTIVDIDNANKWGFAHELGPFEIWDAVGVAETLPRLATSGYEVAGWVFEMVDSGHPTFYQRNDKGVVVGYYDPTKKGYVPLKEDKRTIIINTLRAEGKEVERLEGASLLDMGDGVGLLEFHSKMNAIDADIIEMADKALKRLDDHFDGLVISNQGDNFSVGANLMMVVMGVHSEQWDQLDYGVRSAQTLYQMLRYAPKPVVTAPFGMTLGGGAEITMAGARIVAHSELYMGLVEFGVGLIPGWGGCKELLRRVVNPVMEATPNADVLPHLQKVFEQIALAKVSESAMQAREMGFLLPGDRIVMNRDHLLAEAKREVLHLIPNYVPLRSGKIWAAGRDALSALEVGAWMLREGNYATEYDIVVANKLAYILTGGGLSEPQWVDEQYILDLERETILSLMHEEKTLARIQYMLENGSPLRN